MSSIIIALSILIFCFIVAAFFARREPSQEIIPEKITAPISAEENDGEEEEGDSSYDEDEDDEDDADEDEDDDDDDEADDDESDEDEVDRDDFWSSTLRLIFIIGTLIPLLMIFGLIATTLEEVSPSSNQSLAAIDSLEDFSFIHFSPLIVFSMVGALFIFIIFSFFRSNGSV